MQVVIILFHDAGADRCNIGILGNFLTGGLSGAYGSAVIFKLNTRARKIDIAYIAAVNGGCCCVFYGDIAAGFCCKHGIIAHLNGRAIQKHCPL